MRLFEIPRRANSLKLFEARKEAYLLDLAKFVDVALVPFHTVLGQLQMRRVFAQLLLILRHLLDHLGQIPHTLFVALRHSLRFRELFQILRNVPEKR